MDKSVRPGDDFFEYANGNWYRNAVIRRIAAPTGSFQTLQILSEKPMQDLIAEIKAKPDAQLSDESGRSATFTTPSPTRRRSSSAAWPRRGRTST